MKLRKTTAILLIAIFMISTLAVIMPVLANTTGSSTMHFEGGLADQGDGVYTGTIAMTAGEYYVTGGPGEDIWDQGGFDVYAEAGGTTYVEGMTPDNWIIGMDHDAYSESGGPWGQWYDPDCVDWNQYELELTEDHWYLRYASTGESPMSGIMIWRGDGTGYAAETDPGTVRTDVGNENRDATRYTAGSAQEWGWHCGWGEERIPLEFPGFEVEVSGGSDYQVTLTPAPAHGLSFGGFVSRLAKAGVAKCLDALDLDFGDIFVSSTAGIPLPITKHYCSARECWRNYCASPDLDRDGHPDYAAQWFTSVSWITPGNDYVIIWSQNIIPGYTPYTSNDFNDPFVKARHDPEVPLADHGVYYAYVFDVTKGKGK